MNSAMPVATVADWLLFDMETIDPMEKNASVRTGQAARLKNFRTHVKYLVLKNKDAGQSQAALAREIGVDKGTIGRWMTKGITFDREGDVAKFAKKFGVILASMWEAKLRYASTTESTPPPMTEDEIKEWLASNPSTEQVEKLRELLKSGS